MTCAVLHADAFEDNYIWIVTSSKPTPGMSTPAIIVDPGDSDPVFSLLENENLQPAAIFCTHHHGDHVEGAPDIADRTQIPVYGPAKEKIRAVTHPVDDDDLIEIEALNIRFKVLAVPGHTNGHIAFYGEGMLFCGDTLFSAGCGRVLGGTHEALLESLKIIARLPGDTAIYCAHEYTMSNLRFARAVEPNNQDLLEYESEVEGWRAQHQPSLPSRLDRELMFNPFLRCDSEAVRQAVEQHEGRPISDELAVFTALRQWKDRFRG